MMDVKPEDLLEVGVVIGIHGLRGDVKIDHCRQEIWLCQVPVKFI